MATTVDATRQCSGRVEEIRPREFNRRSIGALVAATVAMALGPTGLLLSTYSLFIEPMARDLGWNRAQAALPVTLMSLAVAATSVFKGLAIDRWGPRAIAIPLTMLLGVGIAALAVAPRAGWAVYGIFLLIGIAAPGNVPFGRIVASWFGRRLGLAYGLLGFGITLAMPPLLQIARLLVDGLGWRVAYAAYGGAQLLVTLPLLILLFRQPTPGLTAATPAPPPAVSGVGLDEALRSSPYWLVVVNLVATVIVMSAIATHGVPVLTQKGLGRESASWALSAFFVGTMLSQPVMGFLLDRRSSPRIVLPFAIAAIAGFCLIIVTRDPAALILGLGLVGLGCGGEAGTTQYLVARYFGLRRFSAIYGSIQPFTMAGGALLGASAVGAIYDRSGSYGGALVLLTVVLLLGSAILLVLPTYRFGLGDQASLREGRS